MLAWFQFNETSPAAAGTAASSSAVMSAASYLPPGVAGPLDDGEALDIVAELVGATNGTLDIYLQTSLDDGLTWYDSVHFVQLAGSAAAIIYRTTISHIVQPTTALPVPVGKNLNPVLTSANGTVQGSWGTRCRLVFVAGSGTSAGAAVKVTVGVQRPRLELI